MHYLEIPTEIMNRPDARELLRFWVCDGEDFVLQAFNERMREHGDLSGRLGL
jgi:hypothetical protein